MASPEAKQLGITAPLSTRLPTEAENQASSALIEELKRQRNYESPTDTEKRTKVLQSLQMITEDFVKQVSRLQGLPEVVVNSSDGKIFTFGSFRLGVYGPGSDIDTLVVDPMHVSRDDFFKYFPDLLSKLAPNGSIKDLTPVLDSFVPIIKSRIFCQVPIDQTLKDNTLLRGLEEVDLRSLNGTRVTDEILDLVPQKAIFRTALRGIKLWAQRRAVYANTIGFLGGVAWAMLVARVCQLYPRATSSTIILKFFRIMEKWQWPTPVWLKKMESSPVQVRVWNPQLYKSDALHLMPIITPAYPSMCATHNVTKSTKKIILRELKRGGNITDQILTGKAPWKNLFSKHTFFTQGYKYYLSVVSASITEDAQLLWSGLVESKVRLLVSELEKHESISLAHPFNKGFERVHKCSREEEIEKAKRGSLVYQVNKIPSDTADSAANGDEKPSVNEKHTTVFTTTYYIGLELREGAKTLDLSQQVDSFKIRCANWKNYNHKLNALSIAHTRKQVLI
ncbi:MAG: polynucleotide adenylyltransferase [Claussenomyces sp. TS43310]|nr:MAG: polynucleotide adenylyltransferase [Claussenomyces sp. TS43310]